MSTYIIKLIILNDIVLSCTIDGGLSVIYGKIM